MLHGYPPAASGPLGQSGTHRPTVPPLTTTTATSSFSSSSSSSSTTTAHHAARPPARSPLPDRRVATDGIEDAYVQFVLHCNPAVALDTDTSMLREAFRSPPKSGGKLFSPFALFRLIQMLEEKEIKTWAELVLRLGVEPPDPQKGESAQKVPQYAARLKRWMKSMHIDAFFEYLLERPHPYWTNIPTDLNPVLEHGRDGVLPEDDMALRALIPHIRPKRGRRKPEDDDLVRSPSQRLKLESSPVVGSGSGSGGSNGDDFASGHHGGMADGLGPWSAHPDGRGPFGVPLNDRLSPGGRATSPAGLGVASSDGLQRSYPQSAVTPSTVTSFWGGVGSGQKSAPSPIKSRNKRHGAKVVSSAWRQGGPGGSGKTRGRPPINRSSLDGSFSAFPASPINESDMAALQEASGAAHGTAQADPRQQQPFNAPPKLSVPSRLSKPAISLQVPDRAGVPLSSSPTPTNPTNPNDPSGNNGRPYIAINGRTSNRAVNDPVQSSINFGFSPAPAEVPRVNPLLPALGGSSTQSAVPAPADTPADFFKNSKDRSNIDCVHGYFVREVMDSVWYDAQGRPIPSCGAREAGAIVYAVMDALRQGAGSDNAFLMKLAALSGGRLLLSAPAGAPPAAGRVTRLEVGTESSRYRFDWEFRLGPLRGSYSIVQRVNHDWKKDDGDGREDKGREDEADEADGETWRKRYEELREAVKARDHQIGELKSRVLSSVQTYQR